MTTSQTNHRSESALGHSPGSQEECCEIERRSQLSYEDFIHDYLFSQRPVILTDGIGEWRALGKWTPAYLREAFGDREVLIDGETYTMRTFIDRLLHATDEEPAPYLIAAGPLFLKDLFPELVDDITPTPKYLLPNWFEDRYFLPAVARKLNYFAQAQFFVGGRGGGFPYLHFDTLFAHVFSAQVYGAKHWWLFSPKQSKFLYPTGAQLNQSPIANVEQPDLSRFPLFQHAKALECTLQAGEMLFVPPGWWHTTRMSEPSISISLNTCNASNWSELRRWVCHGARRQVNGAFALSLGAYLSVIGWLKARRDRLN